MHNKLRAALVECPTMTGLPEVQLKMKQRIKTSQRHYIFNARLHFQHSAEYTSYTETHLELGLETHTHSLGADLEQPWWTEREDMAHMQEMDDIRIFITWIKPLHVIKEVLNYINF